LDRGDRLEDQRDQRPQILDAIPDVNDHHCRNADSGEILLISQVAVRRQDDIESGRDGLSLQDAVS
jgi:hypothetical protein